MQRTHLGLALVGVFERVMRMHAGRRIQEARVRACDLQRMARPGAAGAGHHHLHDAGRARPRQHRLEIVRETFVAEVGADIDQFERSGHASGRMGVGADSSRRARMRRRT